VRDFSLVYDRYGSFATGGIEATSQRMSASLPKADKENVLSASPLRAKSGLIQCSMSWPIPLREVRAARPISVQPPPELVP
jgi:hypothetical protein